MKTLNNLSISILSEDPFLKDSLKAYIHSRLPENKIEIGLYSSPQAFLDEVRENSAFSVLIFDYSPSAAEELKNKSNELLHNFTIINLVHDNPAVYESKFALTSIREYTVTGSAPFEEVFNLLKDISKRTKLKEEYTKPNLWVASLTFIAAVLVLIFFLTL